MSKKKLTTEEFINRSILKHGNKYSYEKVQIMGSKIKVVIVCPIHSDFLQEPTSHVLGFGCRKCGDEFRGNINRAKLDDFIVSSQKIHMNKYSYEKVDYKDSKTKVCITCPIHGDFWQMPNTHLMGGGCVKCSYDFRASKSRLGLKMFIENAEAVHGNKYNYSKFCYTNTDTKSIIICNKHGEFLQSAHNHLKSKGCPRCKSSKGEAKIENFLIDNNIKFITQKRFRNCRHKNPLPFDFYIPSINACIEFDGIQHFKIENFAILNRKSLVESIIPFEELRQRDEIKTNFCKDNGINLLRISYKQINTIESLLSDFISTFR